MENIPQKVDNVNGISYCNNQTNICTGYMKETSDYYESFAPRFRPRNI